jgi:hypothetical protein
VARLSKAGATWLAGATWAVCGEGEAADVVEPAAVGAIAGTGACNTTPPDADTGGARAGDAATVGGVSACAAMPADDGAALCRIDTTCDELADGSVPTPDMTA